MEILNYNLGKLFYYIKNRKFNGVLVSYNGKDYIMFILFNELLKSDIDLKEEQQFIKECCLNFDDYLNDYLELKNELIEGRTLFILSKGDEKLIFKIIDSICSEDDLKKLQEKIQTYYYKLESASIYSGLKRLDEKIKIFK